MNVSGRSGLFKLGVLMLDTHFDRIPGDIGNPDTFTFPVIYRTVKGANVKGVIIEGDRSLVPRFAEEGRCLLKQGASLVTTSCGFLARFQREIGVALRAPFVSSSLLQLPLLFHAMGQKGPIGIITASKAHLGKAHFEGVGAANIPVRIAGMDGAEHFRQAIMEETAPLNPRVLEGEVKRVAKNLLEAFPDIPALVLECTNLSPYRHAIREEIKRPVFDLITLLYFFTVGWQFPFWQGEETSGMKYDPV